MNVLGPYLAAALTIQDSYINSGRTPKAYSKYPKTKAVRNRRAKNKKAKIARKRGRK